MLPTSPPSTRPTTETSAAAEKPSTLYPKIGQFSDFIYRLKKAAPETTVVPIVGNVKLHGTHADWVITNDDAIRVQSRNVLELSDGSDSYGLFAFTSPIHTAIIRLRDDITHKYRQLNPTVPIDPELPVIISGEWCGKGIQKGVAVSELERHFVIISIRVNDAWVDENEYADIHDEANGIYHISKAGRYHLDYDLEAPESSERAIRGWVDDIEKSCPYGAVHGVHGPGEGIVWKPVRYLHDPEMWFKSKAESHTVSNTSKLSKASVASDNRQRENNFAKAALTERRLQQAWDYLKEMGITRDKAATGRFLSWVTNDVLVEEEREMAETEIDKGKLKCGIKSIATPWYKRKLSHAPDQDDTELQDNIEKVESVKV
ncbi:MAG: hypothetical protein L6R39_001831 [Caloplaca ligustica]|nr:MAG: hypothetical protein L6R39_001831 [Caloplaca ligustica]